MKAKSFNKDFLGWAYCLCGIHKAFSGPIYSCSWITIVLLCDSHDIMISPQYVFFVKDVVWVSRRLALAPDWGVRSCLEVRMSRVISSPGTYGLLFSVRLTLTQGYQSRPHTTHPEKQIKKRRFLPFTGKWCFYQTFAFPVLALLHNILTMLHFYL